MAALRGPRSLSVPVQHGLLRAIGFRGGLRRGALDMRGHVQPTALTDLYLLRIRYKLGRSPQVTVEEPELEARDDGQPVPHVYPGLRLCLYRPHAREWRAVDRISETIVPWAMEWLYFYEVWHATGVWIGGGEHPSGPAPPHRRQGRAR